MQMIPRPEYPRPRLVRNEWLNLNGTWEFEIDNAESGEARKLWEKKKYDSSIIVPFCPESRLSGLEHKDFIRCCWYKRVFRVPQSWVGGRILLHFGAVNFKTTVYVNGVKCDAHEGGYVSFTRDITSSLKNGENTLVVCAASDVRSGKQPSGKQSSRYESHGCSYTRTTGIWQTVWLEHVPELYIEKLFLTPDTKNRSIHIHAVANKYAEGVSFSAEASFEGKSMGSSSCQISGNDIHITLPLKELYLWEAGNGRLYDLFLQMGEDSVYAYFGMRTVGIDSHSFLLNGKPLYLRTVLDQGFNPDGVITAPDDAQLRRDIEVAMEMGFNGARLHQKIFEERYLYWADKMGYLVWGEHGNWGLDISDGEGLLHFLPEWIEEVERDYSAPSIVGWCPFNETQGNSELRVLEAVYHATKALDPTRPCIDTSGWMHCEQTDIYDYHDYTQEADTFRDNLTLYVSAKPGELFPRQNAPFARYRRQNVSKGQPIFLSEYGGIGFCLEQDPENMWSYGNNPTSVEQFLERLSALTNACLTTEGIMGFCYTQLTDVEQEINGLLTYDRHEKFPKEKLYEIFSAKAWNE